MIAYFSLVLSHFRNRVRATRPEDAVRWFPRTLVLSSLLVMAVLYAQGKTQGPAVDSPFLWSWALLSLAIGAGLWGGREGLPGRLPSRVNEQGFVSFVIAIEAGILLLAVPVYLDVWRTSFDEITGWREYGLLNKRWLVGLYGLALVAFLVLPVFVQKILGWADHADIPPQPVPGPGRSYLVRMAAPLIVAAVVLLVAGPPWNLDRHHRGIDHHEQVHLGAIQAIHKGFVPYVGPASTQYGPGSQAFQYTYMALARDFSIVSHRESFLALHLVAFSAVAFLALGLMGFWPAILVIALSMIYSPLSFYQPTGDGAFGDMFGWANDVRYLGTIIVVPALAWLARMKAPRAAGRWAVATGFAWGVLAWMSQENLSSVLTGGGCSLPFCGSQRR